MGCDLLFVGVRFDDLVEVVTQCGNNSAILATLPSAAPLDFIFNLFIINYTVITCKLIPSTRTGIDMRHCAPCELGVFTANIVIPANTHKYNICPDKL